MKANYVGNPEYEKANEKGHIQLCQDFCFAVDGKTFWLPSGYLCDGASIPRPFWSIIGSPFDPEKVPAAFVHDAIYLTHAFNRSDADEILFQLLQQGGCRLRTARTMWAAVRGFAQFAWSMSASDKSDLAKTKNLIEARVDKKIFENFWFTQTV
jgi:hypothetical protein